MSELISRCGASKAERESLEEVIGELFRNNHVSVSVISCLWTKLQDSLGKFEATDRDRPVESGVMSDVRCVVSLLAMIAKSLPEVLTWTKVSLLVNVLAGLNQTESVLSGVGVRQDMTIVRETCKCLQHISRNPAMLTSKGGRVDMPCEVLERLVEPLRRVLLGVGVSDDEQVTKLVDDSH